MAINFDITWYIFKKHREVYRVRKFPNQPPTNYFFISGRIGPFLGVWNYKKNPFLFIISFCCNKTSDTWDLISLHLLWTDPPLHFCRSNGKIQSQELVVNGGTWTAGAGTSLAGLELQGGFSLQLFIICSYYLRK